MKIQSLILFSVLFVCACQISQKAQINELPAKSDFNKETNTNIVERKEAEIEQPKKVDKSAFSSIKIRRTDNDKKFLLKVNVEYPQLKEAKNPRKFVFNQYVKKKVSEQIADFNKFLVNKNKEVKSKSKHEYEINLDFQAEYVSENFISILMNWDGYSGYLNQDVFPSTINFDLTKGKAIKLIDLFEPNSKYLEKLSETSFEKLKHTCLLCPCKDGTNADEPLPEGIVNDEDSGGMFALNKAVSAKEENFSNWSVTAEGLKITFHKYQVGPGCIGIIHIVIPFNDLQPILRKDLNFN